MFNKIKSNSALPDTRPDHEREKDYLTKEITTSAVVPFQNNKIKKINITEFNQWYVGSCVPHAFYTQLQYEGILSKNFNQSQLRAYRKRSNYPSAGSNGVDMYNKIKEGQSNDFPTPKGFTDKEANAMPYITGNDLISDFNYFQYYGSDGKILINDLISDVASGKAVSIFIYATNSEWSREYVEVKDSNLDIKKAYVRHAVCLIPKGDFTDNGKSWLSVQDSAKFGGLGLRYISYDFLLQRCYFAGKVYKKDDSPTPPPVKVNKPLSYCEQGYNNSNVIDLQKYLIKGGYLKPEYATGYYGTLTAKAVLWFQLYNHKLFTIDIPEILKLEGKYWGSQSIEAVKKMV